MRDAKFEHQRIMNCDAGARGLENRVSERSQWSKKKRWELERISQLRCANQQGERIEQTPGISGEVTARSPERAGKSRSPGVVRCALGSASAPRHPTCADRQPR